VFTREFSNAGQNNANQLHEQLAGKFVNQNGNGSFLVISGWFAGVALSAFVLLIAVVVYLVYARYQDRVKDTASAAVRVLLWAMCAADQSLLSNLC